MPDGIAEGRWPQPLRGIAARHKPAGDERRDGHALEARRQPADVAARQEDAHGGCPVRQQPDSRAQDAGNAQQLTGVALLGDERRLHLRRVWPEACPRPWLRRRGKRRIGATGGDQRADGGRKSCGGAARQPYPSHEGSSTFEDYARASASFKLQYRPLSLARQGSNPAARRMASRAAAITACERIPRRLRSSGPARTTAHGRTQTKEREQLITDFPDSNRFHRLLPFDYASALNEPGRCSFVTAHQSSSGARSFPTSLKKRDRLGS